MTQHTQGEWKVCQNGFKTFVYADVNDFPICNTNIENRMIGECEANARLIAAAPKLLEALEHLVAGVDDMTGIDDECCFPDSNGMTLRQIKAAIAAAKGEA